MRRRGLGTVLVGFGAALAFIVARNTEVGTALWLAFVHRLTVEAFYRPHSWVGHLAWRTARDLVDAQQGLFGPTLVVAFLATVGMVVARSVAWRRVRDGRSDPLDRLRSRPRLQRVLAAAPAALVSVAGMLEAIREARMYGVSTDAGEKAFFLFGALSQVLVTGGVAALVYTAARMGLASLLAPVGNEVVPPKDAGEIVFSAVAVTPRTRAMVGALAAVTVAVIAAGLINPSDPRLMPMLAAYVATAMAAPFALRRASRITVGIDGVWVGKTSRRQFFPYRDVDEARARGADLELVRRGRSVLRLQMHGDDAERRDEVLGRINDAIARSRESAGRGAEMVVQALPTRQVVATTTGSRGYRLPTLSREQLWELVEGAAADAPTRAAAAEVLAVSLADGDRSRLRVAASRCAEPRLRVALDALAGEEVAEAEADVKRREGARSPTA
jgi:hypothetical protein